MSSITEKHSLEAFANPHLLDSKNGKITEDVVAYVLPLFLEGFEVSFLANANREWKKVLQKHAFSILNEWKKHSFLKTLVNSQTNQDQPFKVIESIFFDALEKQEPLIHKFGHVRASKLRDAIQHASFHSLPKRIDDLNLIAFSVGLKEIPIQNKNETIVIFAERVRIWIKNTTSITRLTSWDLRRNNMTSLPKEISFFKGLKVLDLSSNKLNALPDSIGALSQLEELTIWNNSLCSLPDSLSKLKNLKVLILTRNQLSSLPDSIENLNQLQRLELCENQFRSLPNSIGHLTQLQWLYASKNHLNTLPESIGNLTSLKYLMLSGNQLSSLPNSIVKLSQLKMLYLENNQLESLPETIGNLKSLTSLYLENNQLRSLPQSFSKLARLGWLYLQNNQLNAFPEPLRILEHEHRERGEEMYVYTQGNPITIKSCTFL